MGSGSRTPDTIEEGQVILMEVRQGSSGGYPAYGCDSSGGYGAMSSSDITLSNNFVVRVMSLYNRDESPRGFRAIIELDHTIDILYVVRLDTLKGIKFDATFIGGSAYPRVLTKELLITTNDIYRGIYFYAHDTPPPFDWTDISL